MAERTLTSVQYEGGTGGVLHQEPSRYASPFEFDVTHAKDKGVETVQSAFTVSATVVVETLCIPK